MPDVAEDSALEKLKRRLVRSNTHQHEGWAVGKEKLHFERWGGQQQNVGVFSAPSLNGTGGELWYRAMGKREFDTLFDTGRLEPRGYGGITRDRGYVEHYLQFSRKRNAEEDQARITHVVEFMVHYPISIDREMAYLGVTAKAENGTMSYGLGPGQRQGAGGGYFNELLVSRAATWRLVGLVADA